MLISIWPGKKEGNNKREEKQAQKEQIYRPLQKLLFNINKTRLLAKYTAQNKTNCNNRPRFLIQLRKGSQLSPCFMKEEEQGEFS